jgi:hypothetical protein
MPNQPDFARLLATSDPPHLGPTSRPGVWSEATITSELATLFKSASLPEERQDLIRAVTLLWHDHLEAAHEIAQGVDNPHGAFVHGIMHRREPDYGNAAYWFRRVGTHPAFPMIAREVSQLAKGKEATNWKQQLIKNESWDPFAFIDACARVAGKTSADADRQFLREVQRIEFEALLEHLAGPASVSSKAH